MLESTSTKKELNKEKECSATWELKIMESSCPMLTKKTLLMLSSMLLLELQDKDAWHFPLLSLSDKPKNGSKISVLKLNPSKSELEMNQELI